MHDERLKVIRLFVSCMMYVEWSKRVDKGGRQRRCYGQARGPWARQHHPGVPSTYVYYACVHTAHHRHHPSDIHEFCTDLFVVDKVWVEIVLKVALLDKFCLVQDVGRLYRLLRLILPPVMMVAFGAMMASLGAAQGAVWSANI